MIAVGRRFNLPEENIAGVVTNVYYNEYGEPAAIVVEQDNGTWASVDMSKVEMVTLQ